MHNLCLNFAKVVSIVKGSLTNLLNQHGNIRKPGPQSKFSDAEIIALSLLAEMLMLDSENYLFKLLQRYRRGPFLHLIDRSRFNRRRRALHPFIERVRVNLAQRLTEAEDIFIIDAMPVPVCRFARARRLSICQDDFETRPSYGYSVAMSNTFFGYKLHCVCSKQGVISHFGITQAHFADIRFLENVKAHYRNCLILADRTYLSQSFQQELFEEHKILLQTPKRANQIDYQKQPVVFRKSRKRIETVYSQLSDQFQIQRNYAKSFIGLATRILTKITAFTMLQFLNRFVFDKQINHVKHAML